MINIYEIKIKAETEHLKTVNTIHIYIDRYATNELPDLEEQQRIIAHNILNFLAEHDRPEFGFSYSIADACYLCHIDTPNIFQAIGDISKFHDLFKEPVTVG